MTISIIAAIAGSKRALGYQNKLLFWIKEDLQRFKKLTTGHTIIMGKNTFDSLPKGALPNRRNIVLSRSVTELPECEVFKSLDDALLACKNDEVFIIGGASVYAQALKKADKLYLTEIHNEPENADVFFPEIPDWFDVKFAECKETDDKSIQYDFVDYVRNTDAEVVVNKLIENQKPLDGEFSKTVDDNFWEIV